jgi:hypothetical protein
MPVTPLPKVVSVTVNFVVPLRSRLSVVPASVPARRKILLTRGFKTWVCLSTVSTPLTILAMRSRLKFPARRYAR